MRINQYLFFITKEFIMARSHFSYSGSGYVSRGSSNSGATHSYKGTTTYSNGSSRSYTGTITHVGNTYQGTTTYSDGSSRSYNGTSNKKN